ncbi:MAG: hypothetical protein FJW34_20735 [Acidobacteria bacterium]|nr:hypothetical protein [Acidobacteriota bacterium]
MTDEEKSLGRAVKAAVDATPGFEAYFAESVHDLDALGSNVFDALRRCSGALFFLHERGTVIDGCGSEWGHRSSVWVNQEVAVLAYRQFLENGRIPILVFKDPRVKLEGAMTALIVNALPMPDAEGVVEAVRSWLVAESFPGGGDDVFSGKWVALSEAARRVLACLVDQGGQQVGKAAVRGCLSDTFGLSKQEASTVLSSALLELRNADLVLVEHDIHSGDRLSLHPTWEFHLRRAVAGWRQSRP